jgi:hypothetical protein
MSTTTVGAGQTVTGGTIVNGETLTVLSGGITNNIVVDWRWPVGRWPTA